MSNETIPPPLPEVPALQGRFFVNMPDLVNPTYWKKVEDESLDPMPNENGVLSSSNGWSWRTIGDNFNGTFERRKDDADEEEDNTVGTTGTPDATTTKNGDTKLVIKSFPSPTSPTISLSPFETFRTFENKGIIENEFDPNETVTYTVTMYVARVRQRYYNWRTASRRSRFVGGTKNIVRIKIIGTMGETESEEDGKGRSKLILNPSNQFFEDDTRYTKTLSAKNVGQLRQFEVTIDGGDDPVKFDLISVVNNKYPKDEAVQTTKAFSLNTDKPIFISELRIIPTLPKRIILTAEDIKQEFREKFLKKVQVVNATRDSRNEARRSLQNIETKIEQVNDIVLAFKELADEDFIEKIKEIENKLIEPIKAEILTEASSVQVEITSIINRLNRIQPDNTNSIDEDDSESLQERVRDVLAFKTRFRDITFGKGALWASKKEVITTDVEYKNWAEEFPVDPLNIIERSMDLENFGAIAADLESSIRTFITFLSGKLGIAFTAESGDMIILENRLNRSASLINQKKGEISDVTDKISTVEKAKSFEEDLDDEAGNIKSSLASLDSALSNESGEEIGAVVRDFLGNSIVTLSDSSIFDQPSDEMGFLCKTIDSSKFEISQDFTLGASGSILPAFGIMIRDNMEPTSPFFGLIVVPRSVPLSYGICTFVRDRTNSSPRLTGSLKLGAVEGDMVLKLKVTREGSVFKGFENGVFIGGTKFNITKESAKARQSQIRLNSSTFKTKVIVGVACFSVPLYMVPETGVESILYNSLPSFLNLGNEPTLVDGDDQSPQTRAFALVEYYNLSLFSGRYGPGRTLKTLSILPGEEINVTIQSYKDSTTSSSTSNTVFEEITDETQKELEETIEQEQSNESQYEKSMNFHVDASFSYSNWGATASVSTGYEQSTASARQDMSRSLTNAVEKIASKASSKRTIEINSTQDTEVRQGSSRSVRRKLTNISNSKAVDYIYRQMNQEYVSILHLVDIKVAYIGGGEGTYSEDSLANLDTFLKNYIKKRDVKGSSDDNENAYLDEVKNKIIRNASFILDYNEDPREVLERVTKTFDSTDVNKKSFSFYRFKKGIDRLVIPGLPVEKESAYAVKGFIIAYTTNIVRTDGVITQCRPGEGSALDSYGANLEMTDIEERQAKANLIKTKQKLLDIQFQVVHNYLCRISEKDTANVETGGALPAWIQKKIGEQDKKAFNKALAAGLSSLDSYEKKKFEAAIRELEYIGKYVENPSVVKEKIANNDALFDSFGKLLRSLNLLEPKYLKEQSFDFSDGNEQLE